MVVTELVAVSGATPASSKAGKGVAPKNAHAAMLLVCHLRHPEQRGRVAVERATDWLASLPA